jgi:hypothetical protein
VLKSLVSCQKTEERNLIFFNGTSYPETAKTAENDYIHLLACDNGTFTVSHKESGRVFFEMPTVLIGTEDTFAYCTSAAISKSRDDDMATFTSVQKIAMPSGIADPLTVFEQSVVVNTVLHDTSGDILLSVNYECSPFDTVLRFPSGIDNPTVNGTPFDTEMTKPFLLTGEAELTDEAGEVFRVTPATEKPIKVTVTSDGNLDVFLPSIAPATEKTRSQINFIIGFTEYSLYE